MTAAHPLGDEKTWDMARPIDDRLPRQGHYTRDFANITAYPPTDITVERKGDLINANPATLLGNDAAGRA